MAEKVPSRVLQFERRGDDWNAILKKSTRDLVESHRRTRRDEACDSLRSREEENNSDIATVAAISMKLKSGVTAQELCQLKNAILGYPDYIATVLGCPGALHGLTRDISGNDVQKQVEAVGCCSNLALGGSRGALAVARAAGAYIITHATSMSEQLAVASLWALGNLAASGDRPCFALLRQGVLYHLCNLLATRVGSSSVLEAAIYAAGHFVYQLRTGDRLSAKYHEKLLSLLLSSGCRSAWQPLFILSCHKHYVFSCSRYKNGVLDVFDAIYQAIETYKQTDKYTLRLALRCLANLCVTTDICDYIKDRCLKDNYKICYALYEIPNCVEILWFVGNVTLYASITDNKLRFVDIVCLGSTE